MEIKNYRNLEVWQKAIDLVVESYKITERFPKNETFGLASQLQRASVSVPSNIAEGRHRRYAKEFLRHLSISYGSLAELETHVEIAKRLDYIDSQEAKAIYERTAEIGRMLNGLRRSIEKKT